MWRRATSHPRSQGLHLLLGSLADFSQLLSCKPCPIPQQMATGQEGEGGVRSQVPLVRHVSNQEARLHVALPCEDIKEEAEIIVLSSSPFAKSSACGITALRCTSYQLRCLPFASLVRLSVCTYEGRAGTGSGFTPPKAGGPCRSRGLIQGKTGKQCFRFISHLFHVRAITRLYRCSQGGW